MSWILHYEIPPMRGITQVQYQDLDALMDDAKSHLLKGHIIRGIARGRELEHKIPDQKLPEALDDGFLSRLERIVRAEK